MNRTIRDRWNLAVSLVGIGGIAAGWLGGMAVHWFLIGLLIFGGALIQTGISRSIKGPDALTLEALSRKQAFLAALANLMWSAGSSWLAVASAGTLHKTVFFAVAAYMLVRCAQSLGAAAKKQGPAK